jgi:hypothetical protein
MIEPALSSPRRNTGTWHGMNQPDLIGVAVAAWVHSEPVQKAVGMTHTSSSRSGWHMGGNVKTLSILVVEDDALVADLPGEILP